ncbi:MAG: S1C family serine protease [Myxococcales bacterium]
MNPLELSEALAQVVRKNAATVVALDGRPAGSSGVVVSVDGVVVTADHTLEREVGLSARLGDGREVVATLIGRDPLTGVAALKLDAGGLACAEWSSLDGLSVGHLVLALSRPGKAIRASLGIVGVLSEESWRSPAGGKLDRYLQTDLRPQFGFSGGLLVDAAGRALGMSNAALLRGAAMAVPGATVKRVLESLLSHGRVRRGFLGVGSYPIELPAPLAALAGQGAGLLVVSVQPGGPAERAGLLLGDTLLSLDGQSLGDLSELQTALDEERIGREATLKVIRAGQLHEAKVTVGVRP